MKRLLTAEQTRAQERAAEASGTSLLELMQRAGAALAEAALARLSPSGRCGVLCGGGNNGGDGLWAAALIARAGRQVLLERLAPPGPPKSPTSELLALLPPAPPPVPGELTLGAGDVVIDALLGTGLSRPPQGPYAEAIARIQGFRGSGAQVVSADLPSGLDSDTGHPLGPCVQADVTVAFGALKRSHALQPGASRCGEVLLAPIGLSEPPPDGGAVFQVEEADVRARLRPREVASHKGSHGHVLVVAGSPGKTGAAALAGLGALRAGAGLVTVAARPGALEAILGHAPELMGLRLEGEGPLGLAELPRLREAAAGKAALVVGPGLERGEGSAALLAALLAAVEAPFVLDADGLNALAEAPGMLADAAALPVLTPHPGEAARLLGISTARVQADRIAAARALSGLGAVAMLKGAGTVVAEPSGQAFVNPTGNPGMATGGTGDVLAGMVGALLAQGHSPPEAAWLGAYVHGLAGDLAARRTGQRGLVASDLLAGLGEAWRGWGL